MQDIDNLSAPKFRVTSGLVESLSKRPEMQVHGVCGNYRAMQAATYLAASYVEMQSVGESWCVVVEARNGVISIEIATNDASESTRAELVLRRVAQELS